MKFPVHNQHPSFEADSIYVDPWSKVDYSVQIGPNTCIWAFASVHAGVRLGEGVGIGEHTYIGRNTVIGSRTRINQGCHITDHMIIGSNVFMGPHVVFTNDRNPIANNPRYKRECPIVEDDVSIGAGSVILPGVRLMKGCKIGAGAIVTHDVPPHQTWVGNPARELHAK